ncbi:hypothetical protein, partial [Acidithiobacillus sp. HP-11]|uniref:hypothetical protein n=1 Tax=Acidithiobacillus sp. HP-11 TaxID=2697656 RepID=UPI001D0D7988
INTWVSTGASLALARLARHNGVTKREMLEQVLMAEEARVTSGMEEAEQTAYDSVLRSNGVSKGA